MANPTPAPADASRLRGDLRGRWRHGRATRRAALAAVGIAAAGLVWHVRQDRFAGPVLDPAQAHARAMAGDILLVDIRRPEEWAETGVPEGALPLDMRREDFPAALTAALGGDRGRPVALICARGVRSDRVSARLADKGFGGQVFDVPEGMLGSAAGPGWLARGLPVTDRVRPPGG